MTGNRWRRPTASPLHTPSGYDRTVEAADGPGTRRYDQPIEDDDDPVMPSDDSTLNTKI